MKDADAPHALLPQGLGEAVEAVTAMRLLTVKPRGGGASREGAELTLGHPAGSSVSI